MSEPRRFPFGAVPVYNPQSLSKEEALAQFHARQATYQSLMDLLREEHPSHVLFIGTRGMGKTTLLQRVRYGVQDDAELNGRYLVLVFPEEQYNVNRLHHFLLNAVDALADAMERLGNDRMLALVETYAEMAGKLGQEEIEERVPKFLAEIGVDMRRSLLLLVDNADRLFETIEDREQWRLRELLSKRPDLTLFGATTQASEGIYGPDRAFFEFFQIQRLAPLTFLEVKELLLRLSESVEEKEGEKGTAKRHVQEWLDADAARLRTLVQLTGGNPRTTVLLFHLVLEGLAGGAREYLERLLDQSTPNYKGRVDELPAQAQQVLDAVALRWDPVTALEVAGDTGLETSTASTHLTRLVRQGVLEKADPGDSRKALYQVAERFFNIWYLMRASRRVRARLRWFVEFLRVFFDSSELEQLAWEQLERFRSIARTRPADIETVFAYLYSSGADLGKYEEYLRRECADKEAEWRPYVALISHSAKDSTDGKDSGSVSLKKAKPATDVMSPAEMEAGLRKAIADDPSNAEFWSFLGFVLFQRAQVPDEAESALRKAIDLDPKLAWPWCFLGMLLQRTPERLDEAESAFQNAIDLDPTAADFWFGLGSFLERVPERGQQAEAVLRKAIELDPKSPWFWASLGSFLGRTPERLDEAEAALRKAIELDPKFPGYWSNLGNLLGKTSDRLGEAEAALRKAIELDPEFAGYWNNLGILLGKISSRLDEAEAALRKAIDLDPTFYGYWKSLANVLQRTPERLDEAEAALRKTTDLAPKSAWLWANLGISLGRTPGRLDEAEAALRKAVEIDPKNAGFWNALGVILSVAPEKSGEAEAAFRRVIDLDPDFADIWENLFKVLGRTPERRDEAEMALRKALEQDPYSGELWHSFGVFLACQAEKPTEAEHALRKALELEPNKSNALRNLGVLLYCELHHEEEGVEYIRRAHQLEPTDPVSTAILAACVRGSQSEETQLEALKDASGQASFWDELLGLCSNYPPFGKILLGICDLTLERDSSDVFARLHRAVALAQLGDFPRASVALDDALIGDPIDQLSAGRRALEVFFAAAVRNGRVRDCLDLLDKKEWKDAWRPIYEALRAVEECSGEYLKRVAVEIREPAQVILRRIAPALPGLPPQNG
jgi:Flp pilus assembly protein TadD/DNA-binding MarR family transcriptional regulator